MHDKGSDYVFCCTEWVKESYNLPEAMQIEEDSSLRSE
jgi:hypothetical protein